MMGMGGHMISAEETKRMLRQGLLPGPQPPPQPAGGGSADAVRAAEEAAAASAGKEPRALSEERTRYFQISAALTFLDLREPLGTEGVAKERNQRRTDKTEGIGGGERVGVRSRRGSFAGKFLNKAHVWIAEALSPREVVVRFHEEDGCVCASLHKTGDAPLLEEEVQRISSDMEKELEELGEKDVLEWNSMVREFVDCLKKVLTSYHVASSPPADGEWEEGLAPTFDKDRIGQITAEPIDMYDCPGMEKYCIGFGANDKQILYPQGHKFTEEHWKLWCELTPCMRRRSQELVYSLVTWMPHEVIHCIQDMALASGGESMGKMQGLSNWQVEFSACYGQFLFLQTLIAEQRKQGTARRRLPLPSHIAEESLLWLEAVTRECSPQESRDWSARWWETLATEHPVGGKETDPTEWMSDNHPAYIGILGGVALRAAETLQARVEKEEQTTSYWAEFAKYLNRIMGATSSKELPDGIARLVQV